jgi:hypothetical protein
MIDVTHHLSSVRVPREMQRFACTHAIRWSHAVRTHPRQSFRGFAKKAAEEPVATTVSATQPSIQPTSVPGLNILKEGSDPTIRPDSDYPDWVWTLCVYIACSHVRPCDCACVPSWCHSCDNKRQLVLQQVRCEQNSFSRLKRLRVVQAQTVAFARGAEEAACSRGRCDECRGHAPLDTAVEP